MVEMCQNYEEKHEEIFFKIPAESFFCLPEDFLSLVAVGLLIPLHDTKLPDTTKYLST